MINIFCTFKKHLPQVALVIIALFTLIGGNAFATVYGIPVPYSITNPMTHTQECTGEAVGLSTSGTYGGCWLAIGNEPALFGADLSFRAGDSVNLEDEFQNAYFPKAGPFRAREYICQSSSPAWCTIAKSVKHIDAAKSINGSTMDSIQSLNADFGGNSSDVPALGYTFSICLAFVDDSGVAWGNSDAIACRDAKQLPDTPALCRLNGSNTLDVDMGTLELSDIATTPLSGDSKNVKKTISIACSGDSEVNVETQFVFQPITLNGAPAISTSLDNLGVALIYKGKAMSPQDRIKEQFTTGSSNIVLEFATIRNAEKNSVAPGSFSASAVMEMTVQ